LLVISLLTALRAGLFKKKEMDVTDMKVNPAIELATGNWRQPQPTTNNQQQETKKGRTE
jgi:hypothetical protein